MYAELAQWWPLLSPPREYAEEARFYHDTLQSFAALPVRTLLELGSGGGNNASHLKAHYHMTLVDLSAGMLAESRRLNPVCQHHQGDMRNVRLVREFDAVFIHDAVMYMTTEADLRQAIATAFVHTRPGGVALFAPDYVRENFAPGTDHGGADAPDGRGMRYLEWVWDPDASDTQYTVDYAFIVREADGAATTHHDRHIEGLFSREDWKLWLRDAGFEPVVVPDSFGRELFVGRKANGAA
jgi:SAM-dependent methyltransferase